jgi:hypothetical protein
MKHSAEMKALQAKLESQRQEELLLLRQVIVCVCVCACVCLCLCSEVLNLEIFKEVFKYFLDILYFFAI